MILGLRRVLDDVVGYPAVIDHVGPFLHLHRGHRGHGFDALDIDLLELLDKVEHRIELALKMRNLRFLNPDPRQMRDTANSGSINRHYIRPQTGISVSYSRGRFCTATGVFPALPTEEIDLHRQI